MKEKRRDSKGRILHTGESQRTDGKYLYKYVDAFGNTKYVYAWRLTPTDPTSIPRYSDNAAANFSCCESALGLFSFGICAKTIFSGHLLAVSLFDVEQPALPNIHTIASDKVTIFFNFFIINFLPVF